MLFKCLYNPQILQIIVFLIRTPVANFRNQNYTKCILFSDKSELLVYKPGTHVNTFLKGAYILGQKES